MRRKSDLQGFTIVGYIKVGEEETQVGDEPIVEPDQTLLEYTRRLDIDLIVMALDDKRARTPIGELVDCRLGGVEVVDLVSFFEQEAGKILVDFVSPG